MSLSFAEFEKALVGQHVSHVWRGHGSSLFIEFGALGAPELRRDGSLADPTGEISLMIQWSWRIEKPKSIMGGSWSDERKWSAMFEKLKGARVTAARVFGHLPEIEVSLSNGLRVASFMTAEGQPEWVIFLNTEQRYISVRRGSLYSGRNDA